MSNPNSAPPKSSIAQQTNSRTYTENILRKILDPIDVIGKRIVGDLWEVLYKTIQDAIALNLLLRIPSWIGALILGKEFAGFDVCMNENPFAVDRYACFIIVMSDFGLWTILAGRIIANLFTEFSKILIKKRN